MTNTNNDKSLREEIEIKVCEYNRTITSSQVLTDEILEMIEKRIDSIKFPLPNNESATYTKYDVDHIIKSVLRQVKEMLKS